MKQVPCPNCGVVRDSTVLTCPICGHTMKLASVFTGVERDLENETKTLSDNSDTEVTYLAFSDENSETIHTNSAFRSEFRKKFLMFSAYFLLGILGAFAISPDVTKNQILQMLGIQDDFSVNYTEDSYQFKFSQISENGIPVFLEGCEPMEYYIRENSMTLEDVSIVKRAMKDFGDVYGREFYFKGFTEKANLNNFPNSILINFTTKSESSQLRKAERDYGYEIAGLAQTGFGNPTNKPRFGSFAHQNGIIWLDKDSWKMLDEYSKLGIVIHEMGHIVGLDHPANGEGQVMNADGILTPEIGSGDIRGIEILSSFAGCRPIPEYLFDGKQKREETSSGLIDKDLKNVDNSSTKSNKTILNREYLEGSVNQCGDGFAAELIALNKLIPASWRLEEKGSCEYPEYRWTNPSDKSQVINLGFVGSFRWCEEISSEDYEEISLHVPGETEIIKRAGENLAYAYKRKLDDLPFTLKGVIVFSGIYGFCGGDNGYLDFSDKAFDLGEWTDLLLETFLEEFIYQ